MLRFLYKRNPAKTVERVASPPVYEQVWERKRLPDPGAMNFAFETLDLPLQTVIGPAVAVRQPLHATQFGMQPYFPVQHVSLQGIGQVSGGIKSQPLFNPKYNSYSGVSPLRNGDPFPRAEILPAGSGTL